MLTRRTRAAGEELGLAARELRSLSTATYEVGRQLVDRRDVRAEVRLADGPSLQVVFRITPRPSEYTTLRQHLESIIEPLRPMVHELEVAEREGESDDRFSVCLKTLFPRATSHAPERPPLHRPTARRPDEVPADELRDRYLALAEAFYELQQELHETNRGVVAMHAELEANAEKLRQAEDRLRLLLDSVQDYAICMLTPQGEVASWNVGAERLFGYGSEEIIGRHLAVFYASAERDLGVPAEHLRVAEELGRLACECVRVRNGGMTFDAHVLLTPVRRGRELRGFSLVVRDVTERKRLEDNLRRRAEDLAAANRAKEDFLATLSHELRTPLNAMLGWTRLLRMGKLDATANARALETIERNAHIQEQLIADILDVSRIVTGRLRLELRPIELAPVAAAAIDAVRPAAEAKGLTLTAETQFQGTVLGDPDRLQQVLWNLLVNAIKFTPAGGEVTLAISRSGPSARITVADTGEGISDELLPFIFDRFTQGDASVTRPHGGLGLGLSIVRHIVELHGGKVLAQSAGQGEGAIFSVHLPLRAIKHAAVEQGVGQTQPLSGVRVLVVDDDADAREVVSTALAQCGARTAAVASAREAMQIIPEFKPDVLVSDIGMPGEDGFDFIRRLRAMGMHSLATIPAVALTGYTRPEDQRRALLAGFQKFVPKPVEVDELAAVIRTLAEQRLT